MACSRLVELASSIEVSAVMRKVRAVIDSVAMVNTCFADRAAQGIPIGTRGPRPDMIPCRVNRPVHRPESAPPMGERACRRLNPADPRGAS